MLHFASHSLARQSKPRRGRHRGGLSFLSVKEKKHSIYRCFKNLNHPQTKWTSTLFGDSVICFVLLRYVLTIEFISIHTRENNEALDKTYVYEYNSIGNITCVKEYDYYAPEEALPGCYKSVVYTYDTECPDKLKFFDGSRVFYNSMGCPSKYQNKN